MPAFDSFNRFRGILDILHSKKQREGHKYPIPSFPFRSIKQNTPPQPQVHSASSSEDDLSNQTANQYSPPVYAENLEAARFRLQGIDSPRSHPGSDSQIDITALSRKLEIWLAERLALESPLDEKQSLIAQDNLESLLDCALSVYQAGKPFIGENADHLSADDIKGVFAASVLQTRNPAFRQELVRRILGNSHIHGQTTTDSNDEIQTGDLDPPPRSPTLSSTTDGFSSARTAVPSVWEVPFNEFGGDKQHPENETVQRSVGEAFQLQPPQTRDIFIVDEKLMAFQPRAVYTESAPKHPTYMESMAIEAHAPRVCQENSMREPLVHHSNIETAKAYQPAKMTYTETMTIESATHAPQVPVSVDIINGPNIHGGDSFFNSLSCGYLLDHAGLDRSFQVERKASPLAQSHDRRSALSFPGYSAEAGSKKPQKLRVSFATEPEPLQAITSLDEDATGLHDAIKRDDIRTVSFLLEKGVDIFKESAETTIARLPANAIAYCVKYRRKDILSYFILHDIKCYPTAIWETLRYGDDELREFITEKYKERKSQLDLFRLLSDQDPNLRSDPRGPVSRHKRKFLELYSQALGAWHRIQPIDCDDIDEDEDIVSYATGMATVCPSPKSDSKSEPEFDIENLEDYSDNDSDLFDEDACDDSPDSIAALKAVYLILRALLLFCEGTSTQTADQAFWAAPNPSSEGECVDGDGSPRTSGGGGSDNASGAGPSNNKHTHRTLKRIRPNGTGEEENDDDDESNRRPNKKQVVRDDSGKGGCGCPYGIGDANAYPKCLRIRRQDLSGVKEHIKRNHFQGKAPPELYRKKSWNDLFLFCHPEWTEPVPSPDPYIAYLMDMAFRATGSAQSESIGVPQNPFQGIQPSNQYGDTVGTEQNIQKTNVAAEETNISDAQGDQVIYQPSPHASQNQAIIPNLELVTNLPPYLGTDNTGDLLGRSHLPHDLESPITNRTRYSTLNETHRLETTPIPNLSYPPPGPTIPPVGSSNTTNYHKLPSEPEGTFLSSPFQPDLPHLNKEYNNHRQILGDLTNPSPVSNTYSSDLLHGLNHLHPESSLNEDAATQESGAMLPPSSSFSLESVNRVIRGSSQALKKSSYSALRPDVDALRHGNTAMAQTQNKSTPRSESPSNLSTRQEISTPITQISDADILVTTPRLHITQPSGTIDPRPLGDKKYAISVRHKPPHRQKKWQKLQFNDIEELQHEFNGWMAKSFPDILFSWDTWDLQNPWPGEEERKCDMNELVDELENTRWVVRAESKSLFFLVPKRDITRFRG